MLTLVITCEESDVPDWRFEVSPVTEVEDLFQLAFEHFGIKDTTFEWALEARMDDESWDKLDEDSNVGDEVGESGLFNLRLVQL